MFEFKEGENINRRNILHILRINPPPYFDWLKFKPDAEIGQNSNFWIAQFKLLNMKEFHQKSCEVKLTVPFHDLDPMHMVWHGNYMKYFEIARIALFDKFNIDLFTYSKETHYLFPIIKTSTKHIISLKHRDEFICKATLVEANYKIIIDFEIRLVENGKVCTKGRSEQVAVKAPEMEMMLRIPDDIRKAFGFE